VGEYLGAGLPVLSTAGVGDLDSLISRDVGSLVSEHSEPAYRRAAAAMARLATEPNTRERCRELARRELSLAAVGIPRYRALYASIAEREQTEASGSSARQSAAEDE
ncbi:MAG TPA: hypothetical protein VKR21_11060, partial [Solirubrobacteraceae bacterium]|nr:hypothetical protein [Solirubrobacteraceae bacterium]